MLSTSPLRCIIWSDSDSNSSTDNYMNYESINTNSTTVLPGNRFSSPLSRPGAGAGEHIPVPGAGSGSGPGGVVFASTLVDGNSPTPYTDAIQVGIGHREVGGMKKWVGMDLHMVVSFGYVRIK